MAKIGGNPGHIARAQRLNPRIIHGIKRCARNHFGWAQSGMLRRIMPLLVDFFRPGFHPWHHDNESLLDEPLQELPPPTHAESQRE
jgi:predicted metal-dependent hydrolase